jgi:hypothetical protein
MYPKCTTFNLDFHLLVTVCSRKGGIEELRDVIGQQASERGTFSEDNTRNERKSPSTKVDKNMEARVAYTRKSRMVFSVDMTAMITFITKSATWSAKHESPQCIK